MDHEKAAVDQPPVAGRLLAEAADEIAFKFKCAEPSRRSDCRNRGLLAVTLVKFDQVADVDCCDPVSIGETERRIGIQIALDCLEFDRRSSYPRQSRQE